MIQEVKTIDQPPMKEQNLLKINERRIQIIKMGNLITLSRQTITIPRGGRAETEKSDQEQTNLLTLLDLNLSINSIWKLTSPLW
jgi:hypothetical protein